MENEVKICRHLYSKSINEPRPRRCINCGEPEVCKACNGEVGALHMCGQTFTGTPEKNNHMIIKPISPEEVVYDIPDFVIEAVNTLIRKNFRGQSFSIKAKDIIAEGRKEGRTGSNKDWFAEKWMDFEDLYRESGWKVSYNQPCYGDSDFDSYYEFTPRKK